ncbi:MAG: epimerase, partial [Chloroflexota bacterium]|nr:epimerase [Chloroflexota bacterium]
LGRGEPVLLLDFVRWIEELSGRPATLIPAAPPETDIASTHADTRRAQRLLGYAPTVSVREGIQQFLGWYERAVRGQPTRASL